MPFVKTIKKYYKEVVSTEVVFACYYCSALNGYIYAKAPIGQYKDPYRYTSSYKLATQKSNLSMDYDTIFNSLDEETAEVHQYLGMDNRPYLDTATRYSEGDIYEDVTSEVEVSVNDDWTRVEVVKDEYYQLAKPKRFYYDYSNEHNTKIVGSWGTILNGVASGFQGTTNLVTVDSFAPAQGDTWEMMFKLRTGSDITTSQQFLGGVSSDDSGIEIAVASSKWKWWVGTGSSYNLAKGISGTYTVLANTDYWVKVIYDGANIALYYSLDGDEFIQDLQVATTSPIYANRKAFGCDAYSDGSKWLGSIDFNETYINLNGERWWDITKPYVRDGSWIDEGVAYNFTKSNYLTMKEIPSNLSSFEIVFKVTTGSNITTYNSVFGQITGNYTTPQMTGGSNLKSEGLGFGISQNGSSWADTTWLIPSEAILANTTYWIKATWDGSTSRGFYSLDGDEWIAVGVVENIAKINWTTQIAIGIDYDSSNSNKYWKGSIDLNESYIKINNRLWWHGTKVIEGDKDNYAFYEDRLLSYAPILKTGKQYTPLFESAVGGTYDVEIPEDTNVRVTMVGGGGAAAIRGVYDDKGYGWSGGSGGAFIGTFALPKGTYSVTVGSANNNTKGQGGNSATLNPTDLTTHDSYIDGVVRVGGGGSGHYNSSYVGAAGASATFEIEPLSITLNKEGNAGTSGSGGKGSAAAKTVSGGASVWGGYGTGQGCKTSEYASKRGWINGTGGYVRIEMWTQTGEQLY